MKNIWKIGIRLFGGITCLRAYYVVFSQHQVVMFRSVVVTDWTMYILPLAVPFLGEILIVSFNNTDKRSE
jgi:hypothetical protein